MLKHWLDGQAKAIALYSSWANSIRHRSLITCATYVKSVSSFLWAFSQIAVRDSTWMSALSAHSMKCQKALMQVTKGTPTNAHLRHLVEWSPRLDRVLFLYLSLHHYSIRWGPYLQSCQWGFNIRKFKLSQIWYPVVHFENRSLHTLYYITLPNLAHSDYTVTGILINYLYFNFRGPR